MRIWAWVKPRIFIKLKIPTKTGEDDFANYYKDTDILFKIVGWIILTASIKYFAETIKSDTLKAVGIFLSLQLSVLIGSYVSSRIVITPYENYTSWKNFGFIGRLVLGLTVIIPVSIATNYFAISISEEILRYNKRNGLATVEKEMSSFDWPQGWLPSQKP